MTRPTAYQRAGEDFEAYLIFASEKLGTPSRNVAYTATEGVFRVFRSRLDAQDALRMADVLPPVLRAIFVQDWDLNDRRPWLDRSALIDEVQSLRRHHNFAPDTVIDDIVLAVRAHVDEAALDAVLETLNPGAQAFWRG